MRTASIPVEANFWPPLIFPLLGSWRPGGQDEKRRSGCSEWKRKRKGFETRIGEDHKWVGKREAASQASMWQGKQNGSKIHTSIQFRSNREQTAFIKKISQSKNNWFFNLQIAQDSRQVTTLELRASTQKSRIAELESSLVLAHESANSLRKEGLIQQDKVSQIQREVASQSRETSKACI